MIMKVTISAAATMTEITTWRMGRRSSMFLPVLGIMNLPFTVFV
jgi:hypothetical protein